MYSDEEIKIYYAVNKHFFLAYWPDFNKVPDNVTTTFGLPYDYTSVMHYPRYAFSKNGKETIVAKVSSEQIFLSLFMICY